MARFKAQLPNTAPTAMSGFFSISMELNPENNSGNVVTADIRINPIQAFPKPVKSAIRDPYFDSFTPEKTITEAQVANPKIVNISGFIGYKFYYGIVGKL